MPTAGSWFKVSMMFVIWRWFEPLTRVVCWEMITGTRVATLRAVTTTGAARIAGLLLRLLLSSTVTIGANEPAAA